MREKHRTDRQAALERRVRVLAFVVQVQVAVVVLWTIEIAWANTWTPIPWIGSLFFPEGAMQIVAGIVGSLIALVIVGFFGYLFGAIRYRKAVSCAPEEYVGHLDKLISDATKGGKDNITVNAGAIVSTRDDLRGSLVALSKFLNSDIDKLSELIQKDAPPEALYDTTRILEKKWPSKRDQIKIEVRKIISELGLEPF